MQRQLIALSRALAFVGAAYGLIAAIPANATEINGSMTHASEAAALVQAALDAELAGDAARRSELLAEALAADPDCAPARWQSGHVMFDGTWRTPDDVQTIVVNDPRWADYRKLRESLLGSPEYHLTLARYCRDHKLIDEGRCHWAMVLLAAPQNREAREALDVAVFRGRLFTRGQIAALEQNAQNAEDNIERYQSRFVSLCRDATSSLASRRNAALAEIRTLAEPAMMDPLETAAARACAKAPRLATDLHLAVVAALANMPQHDATLRLLNHAVYSDAPEVRQAAALALKPRQQTDYVALLMAALRAPIEVDVDVVASPDGTVHMAAETRQEGPESSRVHTQAVHLETEGAMGYDRTRSNPAAVLNRNLAKAESIAAATQARADAANAEAEELNRRIDEVLRVATGKKASLTPELWWSEWKRENELEYAAEEPVEHTYSVYAETYGYPQAPVLYPRQEEPTGAVSRRPEPRQLTPDERYGGATISEMLWRRNGRPHSCFVPGTPVWTPAGLTAIERIQVGDLVLAQNPQTGELAFRVVLETSLGTPTSVVSLSVGQETIGATLGHRFWVNGAGWEMVKQIVPSMQLHSLKGPVEVTHVEPAEKAACHNLVVDEFHTFFVGAGQILVHDKECPQPVLAPVPGSATVRQFLPLDPPIEHAVLGAN